MSFTIIADSNIACLQDYFGSKTINGQAITVVECVGREITVEVLAEHQPQALLIRSVTQINEELLAQNDSVKFIGSATIGTDHVDSECLKERGICFTNAAGCSKHSVAQYVVTSALTLLNTDTQASDITLGIIGLGNIGSTLAEYAQALGWRVLGYDPLLPQSAMNNSSFVTLLNSADVISIHTPLTHAHQSSEPTHHLIDETAFAHMKADAILINSARGAVISEEALLNDLHKTQRAVVLDVFEHEPTVSYDVLNQLKIATPHIAGYTLEGKIRGTQIVYEAFCQKFDIDIEQDISNLLPTNEYSWQTLQADVTQLEKFYAIADDDKLLRDLINHTEDSIQPQQFDGLRKNYRLRREWTA